EFLAANRFMLAAGVDACTPDPPRRQHPFSIFCRKFQVFRLTIEAKSHVSSFARDDFSCANNDTHSNVVRLLWFVRGAVGSPEVEIVAHAATGVKRSGRTRCVRRGLKASATILSL